MQTFILTWVAGIAAGLVLLFVEYRYFKKRNRFRKPKASLPFGLSVPRLSSASVRETRGRSPLTRAQLTLVIRQAYRETKESNFHLGFRLFLLNLVISCVIASLFTVGWWPKGWLPASPLGPLFFLGLTNDIIDLDSWIGNHEPDLLRAWRLSAFLLLGMFALISFLILRFDLGRWLESVVLSQAIGLVPILLIVIVYYPARLFRLVD